MSEVVGGWIFFFFKETNVVVIGLKLVVLFFVELL